jgi:hypothetical protein
MSADVYPSDLNDADSNLSKKPGTPTLIVDRDQQCLDRPPVSGFGTKLQPDRCTTSSGF